MAGFCESRTGTGESSGWRWRGADGLGGGGGMFAGSEGPERAVAGRYEGRQTRQVPSELFWHSFTFANPCTAAPGSDGGASAGTEVGVTHRRRAALRVGGAALITGHLVQRPVELPVRASPLGDNNESTHPKAAIRQAPGASPPLSATTFRNIPCPHGDSDVVLPGMVLSPGHVPPPSRAGGAGSDGNNRYPISYGGRSQEEDR